MDCIIDIDFDFSLNEYLAQNVAPQCEWAADPEKFEAYINKLVPFLLEQMNVPTPVEVSVSFVTPQRIHELNREFRNVDAPTDVLSFPCDDPNEVAPGELIELGDIVVAPQVCFEQSSQYGNTYVQEVTLLVTHSVLHLLGYDHIEDDEAEEMEAKERELRNAWESVQ